MWASWGVLSIPHSCLSVTLGIVITRAACLMLRNMKLACCLYHWKISVMLGPVALITIAQDCGRYLVRNLEHFGIVLLG